MTRDRSYATRYRGPGLLLALLLLPVAVLAQDADHLLLSEVAVVTRGNPATYGSPFIEITNPTGDEIDLSDVYLSTAHDTQFGNLYWNIVTGSDQGGGVGGNVHCRFPLGMTLAAGDTLNISINGSTQFEAAYGFLPDVELYEEGSGPDAVPEMREAFPGGIAAGFGNGGSNQPALGSGSGASDSIVLYRWDGASDLVQDIDYLIYGTSTSLRVDKSDIAVDGPDSDQDATTYLADTPVANQISAGEVPSFGEALRRLDAVEASEPATGGNGATGHDETGEDLATSWVLVTDQEPAAPAASPFPAVPIVTAGEAADVYAGVPTPITVTAVANDAVSGLTAHYRVDGGAWQTAAGSDQGSDTWRVEIPAQSGGIELQWYATVEGSGGGIAVWPAGGDHFPNTAMVEGVPAPEILSAQAAGAYAEQPCTVTVLIDAVNLDLTGTLYYAVSGGSFDTVAMAVDGTTLTGDIPGQPEGTEVDWYVVVEDSDSQSDIYPADAPATVESVTFLPGNLGAAKLLITEINTGQNVYPYTGMSQIAPEFIEIHNPNSFTVDMSDYYLTDAINFAFSTQLYWYITQGPPWSQGLVGGGHYNDFTARFPEGYTLPAGGTIAVAMAGSSWFEQVYGRLPDLEMYEDDAEADDVIDMRPVFENSSDDPPGDSIFTPGRTSGSDDLPRGIPEVEEFYGEPVILYHWIQGDPTVTDIDIWLSGDAKTGDFAVGFDKNDEPGYLPETEIADQDWITDLDQTGTLSYTRIDADEGTQIMTGSNGVGGRDELSENLTETFALVYPTPGIFFAGLESAGTISLDVEPKTFLPSMGETFPISMVTVDNAETKLRILDLEGRVVITLWDSRFDGAVSGIPDFPTIVDWDGRDQTFERVRAGTYVVHLQSVDLETGDTHVKTAPVVVATRLQ